MDFLAACHFLSALLMMALPVGLAIILTNRWKLGWRLWFVGAATFILSQTLHIPFLQISTSILNRPPLVAYFLEASTNWLVIFNGVFVGLAAGLFEELFRYGMFRWWAKDARSWRTGILTSAGHGGVEAIIAGALALYGFFQLVAYRTVDLSTLVPASQLELAKAQVSSYWSLPWYDAFLPVIERLSAIVIQISMAVLVLQTFVRKQWFWVWVAVLYHAVIDFFTVPMAAGYISKYAAEAIVGGFAVLSLAIIFLLRRPEPAARDHEVAPAPVVQPLNVKPIEETGENLDSTRFQ
jgi:uncharacterized membrane protein YhfC